MLIDSSNMMMSSSVSVNNSTMAVSVDNSTITLEPVIALKDVDTSVALETVVVKTMPSLYDYGSGPGVEVVRVELFTPESGVNLEVVRYTLEFFVSLFQ